MPWKYQRANSLGSWDNVQTVGLCSSFANDIDTPVRCLHMQMCDMYDAYVMIRVQDSTDKDM